MTGTWRVLVTASRTFPYGGLLREQLGYRLDIAVKLDRQLVVVHGDCSTGGDRVADAWGKMMKRQGYPVEVEAHSADDHPTEDFGPWPGCGPKRNQHMVSLGADECLAVIGPCTSLRCRRLDIHGSHGATGCANEAERAHIKVTRFELWK